MQSTGKFSLPILSALVAAFLIVPGANAGNIPLGQPFTLAPGEVVNVGDLPLQVRFDEVLADSRCPTESSCFWEGEATSQVTLGAPNVEDVSVQLHTPLSPLGDSSAEYLGHEVTLRLLSPYPVMDQPIDPDDYRIELMVEEASVIPVEPSTWSTLKARFL